MKSYHPCEVSFTCNCIILIVLNEQREGVSALYAPPLLHHHHQVWVDDRVQTMRYRQHSAVCELAPDGSLDDLVSGHIHIRSRLIQHQDLVLVENGSRQTDELLLTSWEDCVRIRAHSLHSFLQRSHVLSQLHILQCSPDSLNLLVLLMPSSLFLNPRCHWE